MICKVGGIKKLISLVQSQLRNHQNRTGEVYSWESCRTQIDYYYYYLVECYFEQLGNHLIPYNAILTWVATPQVRAEAVSLLPRISIPQHQVHVALLCMNVA